MKKSPEIVPLIIFICVFINDVISTNSTTHEGIDDRIVGGVYMTIQQVPYQVLLRIRLENAWRRCGGSIISETNVLTAAHCLVNAKEVYVYAGSAEENRGTEYKADIFVMHPEYNPKNIDLDVGVIIIQKGIALDGVTTKTISLIPRGYTLESDRKVLVTGWGLTTEGGESTSKYLMGVELNTVPWNDCKDSYNILTSNHFCVGFVGGGKGACQGDSGGPVVLTENGMQAGIVSFGTGCARSDYPGVNTFIGSPAVRDFIRSYTGV